MSVNKDRRSSQQRAADRFFNKKLFISADEIAEHDKYVNEVVSALSARHKRPLEIENSLLQAEEFEQLFNDTRFVLWLEEESRERANFFANTGIAINDNPDLAKKFNLHSQPTKNKGGAHWHRERAKKRGQGNHAVKFDRRGYRIFKKSNKIVHKSQFRL